MPRPGDDGREADPADRADADAGLSDDDEPAWIEDDDGVLLVPGLDFDIDAVLDDLDLDLDLELDRDLDDDVSEPAESPACGSPRRAARPARPVHRRRSRHSFEPDELTDAELDLLLRGWSEPTAPGGRPPASDRAWPAWAKLALVVAGALVVLGAINAAAGDTTETISTRGQSRQPVTTAVPSTAPTTRAARPAPAEFAEPEASTATTPSPPAAAPPPRAPAPLPPARPSTATALPLSEQNGSTVETTTVPDPTCHPSYDPCVPIADDVDCAGGPGNGPAYIDVTVEVIGDDVYHLDRDKDGLGCE